MILVFGSINIDLVARVRAIARPGETVLAESYETAFGGKGANQAVAAARARRDAALPVVMAGAVGDDEFGRGSIANLARNGVETGAVARGRAPTGCAFIAVDSSGENAITVASGANRTVTASAVTDALLGAATILVLQMEIPGEETLALAVRARARGIRVLLNLAPAASLPAALLDRLLATVDLLVVNEHEALAAAGDPGGDCETASRALAARRGLTAIVTLGARGAAAFSPEGSVLRVAARPIQPVDTTGAGDTFVGILAAGIAEGRPLAASLERACLGASLACLALGAQAAMPDAAALDAAVAT